MAVQAAWTGGKAHDIRFEGGSISVGALGPKSTDLVLAGLLACSGRTFQDILRKMRLTVASVALEAEAERSAEPPEVFTRIRLVWTVGLGEAPEHRVRRALDLTEATCTVLNILKQGCPVECIYNIVSTSSKTT